MQSVTVVCPLALTDAFAQAVYPAIDPRASSWHDVMMWPELAAVAAPTVTTHGYFSFQAGGISDEGAAACMTQALATPGAHCLICPQDNPTSADFFASIGLCATFVPDPE